MEKVPRSRAPWGTEPSLKSMAEEVGVDFDELIDGIGKNKEDQEMAEEFGVPEKTITALREHFMSHGLGSIMGQD